MLKKIYKNKGIIYINDNNDINYNNLFIKNYVKYNDLSIKEIENITKKEVYEKIRCKYN